MKKVICAFILSILIGIVIIILEKSNAQEKRPIISVSKTSVQLKPSDVVKAFWENSIKGYKDKASEFVTYMPSDFWESLNRECEKSRIEYQGDANLGQRKKLGKANSDELVVVSAGVTAVESKDTYEMTLKEITSIQKSQLESIEIIAERETDKEAFVRIRYGKLNIVPFQKVFLLYKEENNWKIFIINNGNPAFSKEYAKTTCDE